MADTVCQHIGGLIKAWMTAAQAGSCQRSFAGRYPYGPEQHPAVEVYRQREQPAAAGNRGQRLRRVDVAVNYYLGPTPRDKVEAAWGALALAYQWIDDAIETGRHASYQSGQDLAALAGIEEAHVVSAEYQWAEGGEGDTTVHPSITVTLSVLHRYVRQTTGDTDLASIYGTEQADGVAAWDIDAFKATV